jgi:hypothetical protein
MIVSAGFAEPCARYIPGTAPKVQAFLASIMPTRLLDPGVRAATGVPRKA